MPKITVRGGLGALAYSISSYTHRPSWKIGRWPQFSSLPFWTFHRSSWWGHFLFQASVLRKFSVNFYDVGVVSPRSTLLLYHPGLSDRPRRSVYSNTWLRIVDWNPTQTCVCGIYFQFVISAVPKQLNSTAHNSIYNHCMVISIEFPRSVPERAYMREWVSQLLSRRKQSWGLLAVDMKQLSLIRWMKHPTDSGNTSITFHEWHKLRYAFIQ